MLPVEIALLVVDYCLHSAVQIKGTDRPCPSPVFEQILVKLMLIGGTLANAAASKTAAWRASLHRAQIGQEVVFSSKGNHPLNLADRYVSQLLFNAELRSRLIQVGHTGPQRLGLLQQIVEDCDVDQLHCGLVMISRGLKVDVLSSHLAEELLKGLDMQRSMNALHELLSRSHLDFICLMRLMDELRAFGKGTLCQQPCQPQPHHQPQSRLQKPDGITFIQHSLMQVQFLAYKHTNDWRQREVRLMFDSGNRHRRHTQRLRYLMSHYNVEALLLTLTSEFLYDCYRTGIAHDARVQLYRDVNSGLIVYIQATLSLADGAETSVLISRKAKLITAVLSDHKPLPLPLQLEPCHTSFDTMVCGIIRRELNVRYKFDLMAEGIASLYPVTDYPFNLETRDYSLETLTSLFRLFVLGMLRPVSSPAANDIYMLVAPLYEDGLYFPIPSYRNERAVAILCTYGASMIASGAWGYRPAIFKKLYDLAPDYARFVLDSVRPRLDMFFDNDGPVEMNAARPGNMTMDFHADLEPGSLVRLADGSDSIMVVLSRGLPKRAPSFIRSRATRHLITVSDPSLYLVMRLPQPYQSIQFELHARSRLRRIAEDTPVKPIPCVCYGAYFSGFSEESHRFHLHDHVVRQCV